MANPDISEAMHSNYGVDEYGMERELIAFSLALSFLPWKKKERWVLGPLVCVYSTYYDSMEE